MKDDRYCCVLDMIADLSTKKDFLKAAETIWKKRRYGKLLKEKK